jgi:hypothetical protein
MKWKSFILVAAAGLILAGCNSGSEPANESPAVTNTPPSTNAVLSAPAEHAPAAALSSGTVNGGMASATPAKG